MSNLLAIQMAFKEIEQNSAELIELVETLSEDQLWSKAGNIPNSIGTLARHLTGNLNHYLGAGILKNGYQRERDKEFTGTGWPKKRVVSDFQAAIDIARQAIEFVDEAQLTQPYRTPCGQEFDSLAHHIIKLTTHFAHHCGQADYAQRCIRITL